MTQNILQAHPEVEAIFSHNDEMALGAIEAIGDKDVIVVGFDGNEDAMKAIKSGKLDATVAQQPDKMGKASVDSIIKLMDGKKLEKEIKIPLKLEKAE